MRSSEQEDRPEKILVLRLESARLDSAVVLHCQGQVMFRKDAHALSGLISEVLPSAQRMVVEMGGVSALDDGALGELVLTHMWAEAAGYQLAFANTSDKVQRLLESSNLASVLDVFSTVDEALSAMRQEEARSA